MAGAADRVGARGIRSRIAWLLLASLAAALACYRDPQAAFTQLVEARRLAADMRVELHRSAEAERGAVLADTEKASVELVREATAASEALRADLAAIRPLLGALRFEREAGLAAQLEGTLAASEAVDRELLAFAAENSNAEAQRLAFGPGQELADRVCERARSAATTAPAADAARAELLATRAAAAVREIQALQAPHIAEPEDAPMTRLEARMAQAAATARASIEALAPLVAAPGREEVEAALADLDRFEATHREIVSLSRRNSDVQAFALSLGRKRTLTADADAILVALEEALSQRGFRATR
jgi:hypothetical protein